MAKSEHELLLAVIDARSEASRIEKLLSNAKQLKKNAEEALVSYMDSRELKSFRGTIIPITVIRSTDLHASIVKDTKQQEDKAFQWIEEECGRGDLIRKTIHWKSLSSFVGKMIKAGDPVSDCIKFHFEPKLTLRKAG